MKWTVQTSTQIADLSAPGDWFKTHSKILEVMGIKDAGPVQSEAEAEKIGQKAAEKHRRARSGAATR